MATTENSELYTLLQRAWQLYRTFSNAPEQLRDVQESTLPVIGALRLVYEYSQEHELSSIEEQTLQDHITRVSTVIQGLEAALDDLKLQKAIIGDLVKFAHKFVVQSARISSFYEILTRTSQAHITRSLDQLWETVPDQLQSGDWEFVSSELLKLGHSQHSIDEKYFFIESWLGTHLRRGSDGLQPPISTRRADSLSDASSSHTSSRETSSSKGLEAPPAHTVTPSISAPRIPLLGTTAHEDEELPGYTPGKKPTTIGEKVRNLDQTTAILNAEAAITTPGGSSAAAAAAPPAYTFEEGNDQEMDEEFSRYIHQSIASELKRRYQLREANPTMGPFTYAWLPKMYQLQYAGREEVQAMLDANSFTVMGYQTAPHYLQKIEAMLPILRMSADGTADDTIFTNGSGTIRTMVKALAKYVTIQARNSGTDQFSDLDVLDYEYDTARAIDSGLHFPDTQFEFAQKSYYNLLTYIMGMSSLMREIFSGRAFVERSREELTQLWNDRRMSARTAWIQKQLVGWGAVDEAVLACRDWHSLRPVQHQAIAGLQAWRKSVNILTSAEPPEMLYLKIISATGLPKVRNVQCLVVLYASNENRPVWTHRSFQDETETVMRSQNPNWNKEFRIMIPDRPTNLDIMIVDTGLRGKEVGRVRWGFRNIPGVEKTLDGKSLMYGFDEELAIPISLFSSLKGKETERPILHVKVAWKGRVPFLEQSGLPTNPPGKMFRPNRNPMPMPFGDFGDAPSTHTGQLSSLSADYNHQSQPSYLPSSSTDNSSSNAVAAIWERELSARLDGHGR